MYSYVNGKFEKEAKISVFDLGFLRGYGLFDYMRTYNGKPFHLSDHFSKFLNACEELKLDFSMKEEEFYQIINNLMEKNELKEAFIRLVVTGGKSKNGLLPEGEPTCIVITTPLRAMDQGYYEKGIKIQSFVIERPFAKNKSLSYLPTVFATMQAKDAGFIDALFVDHNKKILEGATSNFFGIIKDRLITNCENIYLGITRSVVLKLAKSFLQVDIRKIAYDELSLLDEAFVTSTNKEVMPVTQIDEQKIGSGYVGSITKELMKMFKQYTQKGLWEPL